MFRQKTIYAWWFIVTFLGWLSDPFKGLSDLQLGDEKVTLNHLVVDSGFFSFPWWKHDDKSGADEIHVYYTRSQELPATNL